MENSFVRELPRYFPIIKNFSLVVGIILLIAVAVQCSAVQCSAVQYLVRLFVDFLDFVAFFSTILGKIGIVSSCHDENVKKYYPHTYKRQLDIIRGNMSMEVSPTSYKNTVHLRGTILIKFENTMATELPRICTGLYGELAPSFCLLYVSKSDLHSCLILIIIKINIYSGWPRKSQRSIVSGLFPLGATGKTK